MANAAPGQHSDRPRVTIVSRIFAPEPSAASFRLQALLRALAGEGARVDVLTAAPAGEPAGSAAPSPQHPARIRRHRVLRDGAGYVRGYLPYLSFDLPLCWRLLRTRRPDVVVVEPPPTTGAVVRTICALRRIPYVYYAADIWSDASAATGAPGPVVRAVRVLERFALRGAAAVLSVNEGVSDRAGELGAGAVATVGNGVDTAIFHRAAGTRLSTDSVAEDRPVSTPPERWYSDGHRGGASAEAPPFLLYAGTASEWQGAEIFARAMPRVLERLPEATLVYLGQGSSWPQLQRLAADLPAGSVRLLQPVDAATSAQWQRSARAAVVSLRPGIGYDFAMPTKMFAALACGTPVIFAGTRPAGDLIAGGDLGWACEYDVDQVAQAMIAALAAAPDETERARLSAWAHEHRSLDAAARRGAKVIRGLAHPRLHGGGAGSGGTRPR